MTGTSAIPELLGLAKSPPVAGDDHIVGADQHRVYEAKLGNQARDLRNLIARMRPRVVDLRVSHAIGRVSMVSIVSPNAGFRWC